MKKPVLNLIKFKTVSRTEKENKTEHFKRRWRERVGYILTDEKYNSIQNSIQKQGEFMYRSDRHATGSVFKIMVDNMMVKVVYDVYNNQLITVLEF